MKVTVAARWILFMAALAIGVPGGGAFGAAVSDADAIRNLRIQYNQAIEARDAGSFEKFLSPTFVEMSAGGEVTRGAKAVADSYAAAEFRDKTFIAYDRRPDTIDIAPSGRFAVERGHWRARFREPGGSDVGGSGLYQAGWIRMDGGWRIQSEAYARLTCKTKPDC